MAELVVLYKTPKDAAAFDKYYFETHVPLAKKLPGLKKYAVSKGPVATPGGPSQFHLGGRRAEIRQRRRRDADVRHQGRVRASESRQLVPSRVI